MTYIVELHDIVLAPWGPSSMSAVAELVLHNFGVRVVLTLSFYYSSISYAACVLILLC